MTTSKLEQARISLIYDLSAIAALTLRMFNSQTLIQKLEADMHPDKIGITEAVTKVETLTKQTLNSAFQYLSGETSMKK